MVINQVKHFFFFYIPLLLLYLRATVICKRVNKTGLLNEQLIDFLFISISQYLSLQCFNHHATDGTFTFCFHFWITLSVLIHTAYILLRVFFCVFFTSHVIWLSFCGSGWVFVFFSTRQSNLPVFWPRGQMHAVSYCVLSRAFCLITKVKPHPRI